MDRREVGYEILAIDTFVRSEDLSDEPADFEERARLDLKEDRAVFVVEQMYIWLLHYATFFFASSA